MLKNLFFITYVNTVVLLYGLRKNWWSLFLDSIFMKYILNSFNNFRRARYDVKHFIWLCYPYTRTLLFLQQLVILAPYIGWVQIFGRIIPIDNHILKSQQNWSLKETLVRGECLRSIDFSSGKLVQHKSAQMTLIDTLRHSWCCFFNTILCFFAQEVTKDSDIINRKWTLKCFLRMIINTWNW